MSYDGCTEEELREVAIQDLETDLACALRDGDRPYARLVRIQLYQLKRGASVNSVLYPAETLQAQYSLTEQLQELMVLANKSGLYDAADVVRDVLERKR